MMFSTRCLSLALASLALASFASLASSPHAHAAKETRPFTCAARCGFSGNKPGGALTFFSKAMTATAPTALEAFAGLTDQCATMRRQIEAIDLNRPANHSLLLEQTVCGYTFSCQSEAYFVEAWEGLVKHAEWDGPQLKLWDATHENTCSRSK